MERKFRYLIIVCIIIGLAITFTTIWKHTFRLVSEDGVGGPGIGVDGAGISSVRRTWKSPEWGFIDEITVTYPSPENARKALEKELESAGTIIAREKSPENSSEVDERVVKIFGNAESREGAVRIIRLRNKEVCYVDALSLEPALAFEKAWLKLEW